MSFDAKPASPERATALAYLFLTCTSLCWAMNAVFGEHRPDVVVCPDPTAVFFGSGYVNHHDHRSVGFATLDAVAPAASSPLYHPEAGPAHVVSQLYLSGTLEPDTWVDVGDHLDTKIAALRCHESQIAGRAPVIEEAVRRRAEDSGRQAGVGYAEGFRRLTLAG